MSQSRKQYVFRPNQQNPLQRQAWQTLQATPPAERRTFVAQAIVSYHNDQAAESRLRKLLREELEGLSTPATENGQTSQAERQRVSQTAIDFLRTLQNQ